jgi:hypothetical protein
MTTRTSTVTGERPVPGQAPEVAVPGGEAVSPGRVRPAYAPVPAPPARPAGRRDACRPAGRPAPVSIPLARPWPSSERVNPGARPEPRPARATVLRRRRTVATVVLGTVLLGLLVLVVRLGGEVAGGAPDGPVPAGTAVVVVAPGESLLDVAHRTAPAADAGAVVARIRAENHLAGSAVVAGRPLVVPAGS